MKDIEEFFEENEIPMLDMNSENFKEEFEFELWSMGSSSDYRNDRERPYNGQSHTDEGDRGMTEVKGLTMRDIRDCFIKAFLISCPDEKYLEISEFEKCWDFTQCKNEDEKGIPTQYLLDKIANNEYVSASVEVGNWRPQMVYHCSNDFDPLVVARNLTNEIEKMMGIYPNIPELK